MQIPKELISDNISNAPYYSAYLEMVAKHDKKIAAQDGGKKKKASKADKSKKTTSSKQSKPAPAQKPKVSQEKPSKPSLAKKASKGKVAEVRKGKSGSNLLMKKTRLSALGQAPVGDVAIREPVAKATRQLMWLKAKEKPLQYLQHKHYALWEVIEFGDSYKPPPKETTKDKGLACEVSVSTKKEGRTVAITAKNMQKKKNDVKVRTTLLLALPDEHQLRFSKYDSAKELWEAILNTFGRNEATKKTKKNQLKQQYGNFKAEGSEILEQTFNSLAPEWLVYTIVWRNKYDLDTMILDDVYNHLKVYKPEVQKRAGSNSQNIAFISSSNTSSGKSKVVTVQGVSTASAQVSTDSTDVAAPSLSYDALVLTNQKWNALISTRWLILLDSADHQGVKIQGRERESYKKDSKVEEPAPKAMIAIDGIGWDWIYMVEEDDASKNHALVADEEEVEARLLEFKENGIKYCEKIRVLERDIELKDNKIKYLRNELEEGMGFNEYCAVLPPPAQVYSPPKKDPSWMGLLEFVDDTVTDYTRPTPSIDVSKSISKELEERWKSNNPSFFEQGGTSAKNKVWVPTIRPKIPTVVSKVPAAKPTVVVDKGNKGKAIKASARWIWKPKQNSSGKGIPHDNIDYKGYWDSSCSRHMTGNISYLFEYEHFNGGYVSFGHGRGKITGKGLIKTGKFDTKGDEGYFVGYLLSSIAFRVFNKRTNKIEENLHVDFLENRTIQKGTSPDSLFDIDTLTNSMNYVPVVVAGTSSTNILGTKEDVHQAMKEKESPLRFIALPNSFHEAQMATSNAAATKDDVIPDNNAPQKEQEEVNGDKEVPESNGNSNPTASTKVSTNDSFELASSSTVETKVPTVSTHVLTGSLSVPPVTSSVPRIISRGGSRFPETLSLSNAMSFENRLEDFFGDTSDAVSLNDVEPNLSNMETAIEVSLSPTLRIHKDHPKSQIIGLVDTPNVWVLVDCPNRVRPIGTKWVLKNKKDKRGIVIKNKAQLVAQGHTLEEGIDYEEVFTPVVRIEAIRLFLPYASYMGFTVYQMDVKSAFLYGTIDEEVYAMQPHGFQDPAFPHRVYKVEKAMYGLHQAPRAWYGTLSKYLLDNGFQKDIRSAKTPMDRENPWGKDGTGKDVELYLHQVTPKECHLHAIKRIFRYLKGHPKLGLWYPKESPFDLVSYLNSDYGGANQDRKYTTKGYDNVADLLTKAFDVGRFMYLVGGDSGNFANGLNRDPVLAFCDCHNMVAILEKIKHNTDFHQIVDFLEASHIRVETMDGETKILAKVNGRQMTVFESSIRRHLKLNDEEGISTFPDNELFENLSLMGYNILPNQSNIATALVCLANNRTYNFFKMIFDAVLAVLKPKRLKADKARNECTSELKKPLIDEKLI
nr:putative ribonuclease H-like domain-containing protein [Tanacetum cinerariifolium]